MESLSASAERFGVLLGRRCHTALVIAVRRVVLVEEYSKAGTAVTRSWPMRLHRKRTRMNPTLKDKAWKLFGIVFNAAIVVFLILNWKSVLAWLFDSGLIVLQATLPLIFLAVLFFAIERGDSVSNHENSSYVVRYFLFRSIIIGFAFALPGIFFPQTRKALRFIRDLEAVQITTELFQLVIVLTLLGLILQGLFYLARSVLRFFSSEWKSRMP